ncbi:replicative DNA helicase loader DnaI [Alteribacillus persepolensis]|uniref:Replicative DNA helicase loader DnaI n=1 Tax=Alteribacillus persepolensis TaxID=568899 RepID=A0A1G8BM32_9BACI|nr:primosomal protein DnaI [Alteribacillus persepolensis]SDH33640.1 replicative DNA helicase loader DnaI [Alteribacillus persepolensis]
MDSIRSSLEHFMDNSAWKQRYAKLKQEVLAYPRVQEFLQEYPEWTNEDTKTHMMKLFEFKRERENCDACPGLADCPNMMQGYQPQLKMEKGQPLVTYHPCRLKQQADERKKQQSLIKSLYIPKEILEATFDDIEQDHASRLSASNQCLQFALQAAPGEDAKGLYLHGKFGVGKTYMMGAVANELAERSISSMMVYVPDFFREMKQALSDGSVQEKIDKVKAVDVLILDDIGAETTSAWVRDDVLGVILQYRLMEKLPTLYTSNYDYEELETHLAYSQKGGIEQMKAKRIMERIKHLTTPIFIDGKNRREM